MADKFRTFCVAAPADPAAVQTAVSRAGLAAHRVTVEPSDIHAGYSVVVDVYDAPSHLAESATLVRAQLDTLPWRVTPEEALLGEPARA